MRSLVQVQVGPLTPYPHVPHILTSIGRRKAADPPPRCRSAEVFFPVLAGFALALLRRLGAPQLHSPDLSGDRLGEVVGELDAADHLVARDPAAEELEYRAGGLRAALPVGQRYVRLGHVTPGEGTTAASATSGCSISTLSSSN